MSEPLAAKRAELSHLKQLLAKSHMFVSFLEEVTASFDHMEKGSATVANTLSRWDEIFNLAVVRGKEKSRGNQLIITDPGNDLACVEDQNAAHAA